MCQAPGPTEVGSFLILGEPGWPCFCLQATESCGSVNKCGLMSVVDYICVQDQKNWVHLAKDGLKV